MRPLTSALALVLVAFFARQGVAGAQNGPRAEKISTRGRTERVSTRRRRERTRSGRTRRRLDLRRRGRRRVRRRALRRRVRSSELRRRRGGRRLRGSLRSRRRAGRPGIIATVGPSSESVPALRRMIRGGMEVARFNLSHGDARSTAALVGAVRRASRAEGIEPPTLLFDLPGGKIRLGAMGERPVTLRPGERFELLPGQSTPTSPGSASVSYPDLAEQVGAGDRLLLDDGKMELRVTGVGEGRVETEVVRGGALRSNLGLAVEGRDLPFPDLSEQDAQKIEIAVENGADWIGVSMVQRPENLIAVRRHLEKLGAGHIKLVAKIESHSALENLDAVVDQADAVMIARGDLSTVVGPDRMPQVQEQIASRARAQNKPFIVATGLLSGMQEGNAPTADNLADVTRTKAQEPGWLMLNETATGESPARIVKTLDDLTR